MKRRLLVCVMVVAVFGVQAARGAEIRITSPAAGAVVSGVIDVRATVITKEEGRAFTDPIAQGGDGSQVGLFLEGSAVRQTEAGTERMYAGEFDTTKLANGRQALTVFLTPVGKDERREGYDDSSWGSDRLICRADVEVVVRNPYQWYWGDIHAHTSYSDGGWFPKGAYQYARDTAKLDFFAVTDHAEILTMEEYADVIAQAEEADDPGQFTALYGVERTNGETGHINFYMSPTHVLPDGLSDFYRTIGEMGLVGHFNHPWKEPPEEGGWRNDFQRFRHDPAADSSMAMVELRDEGEEECYIAMLENGWHVGAAGDEDKHDATWGEGKTWTVALARELTREGILEAFRARRTYSAADRNLRLDFTLDGEDMGSRIARPVGEYTCRVTLSDPDAADVIQRVDVFLDGRVARTTKPGRASCEWEGPVTLSAGEHYCFVRVRQPDERTTWSSPIWVSAY